LVTYRIISESTNSPRKLQIAARSNRLIAILAVVLGFTTSRLATHLLILLRTRTTNTSRNQLTVICRDITSLRLHRLVNPTAYPGVACQTLPTRKNRTLHGACVPTSRGFFVMLAARKDTAPTPVTSLLCPFSSNDTSRMELQLRILLRLQKVVGLTAGKITVAHPPRRRLKCIQCTLQTAASRWNRWRTRWTGSAGPRPHRNDHHLHLPPSPLSLHAPSDLTHRLVMMGPFVPDKSWSLFRRISLQRPPSLHRPRKGNHHHKALLLRSLHRNHHQTIPFSTEYRIRHTIETHPDVFLCPQRKTYWA